MTKRARLDADKTAKPMTELVGVFANDGRRIVVDGRNAVALLVRDTSNAMHTCPESDPGEPGPRQTAPATPEASTEEPVPCGCRKRMNNLLAPQNVELGGSGQAWSFKDKKIIPQTLILLSVQKVDTSKRTKLPLLAATYCPFCGVRMQ